MSKKTSKTKAPTGLQINRKNKTFTFSWKNEDDYTAWFTLEYKYKKGSKEYGWVEKHPNYKKSKWSVDIALSGLVWVKFRVRGKQKDTSKYNHPACGWKESGVYTLTTPVAYFPSATWSQESPNQVTFSAAANNGDTDANTTCVNPCLETSFFYTITDHTTGVTTRYDTGSGLGKNSSLTRGITVASPNRQNGHAYQIIAYFAAYGANSNSGWLSAHHEFATPLSPTITWLRASRNMTTGTSTVQYTINTNSQSHRPVDRCVAQYQIVTYGTDLSGSTGWQDIPGGSISNFGTTGFTAIIEDAIPNDNVLFIRLMNIHDEFDKNYSSPVMAVYDMHYKLKTPSINSVVPDISVSNKKLTINVTNNSDVINTFVSVWYVPEGKSRVYIGDITGFTASLRTQEKIFDVTNIWDEEVDNYNIEVQTLISRSLWFSMESDIATFGQLVPRKPTSVIATNMGNGRAKVTWDWAWDKANHAIISWAESKDAWESTNEPQQYDISASKPNTWYIDGLTTGITWYIRVKLYNNDGESTIYGEWSDINESNGNGIVHMETAPSTPTLMLSNNGIVSEEGNITATWAYVSTDGTNQKHAGIRIKEEVTGVTGTTGETSYAYSEEIFHVDGTQQHIDITGKDLITNGWTIGETKKVVLSVTSGSGLTNLGESPEQPLTLAVKPTVTISNCSIVDEEVEIDDLGTTELRTTLTDLPLTFTISSNIDNPKSIYAVIDRYETYIFRRGDDTEFDGFEGETIVNKKLEGLGSVTINSSDLLGYLDEDAKYILHVYLIDEHDQVADSTIQFEVHWSREALDPEAEVTMIDEYLAAKIDILAPDGSINTDTCDIYRLSSDKPELIYKDAKLGESYYDLYPTIGEFGGHRIVYKTAVGNCIATNPYKHVAVLDLNEDDGDILNIHAVIINFGSEMVLLKYDIDIDSSWNKQFTETKYLGGSIKGDWNVGVSRDMTINTDVIVKEDSGIVASMRRLATYEGVCHVRTPDGSSFNADVQVQEKRENKLVSKLARFTLKITRVDSNSIEAFNEQEWLYYIGELTESTPSGATGETGSPSGVTGETGTDESEPEGETE